MKKLIISTLALLTAFSLAACTSTETGTTTESTTTETTTTEATTTETTTEADTKATGIITVITREDGSGTRGAFTEITGVHDGDVDNTTVEAVVMDGTGNVMSAVSNDPQAIGYISLGSLNDTVKALTVEDVAPSTETILDGTYKVARPFNIATKTDAELNEVATEFLAYVFTAEAQAITAEEGYVPVEVTTAEFVSTQPAGDLTIGGSTSVYPLIEKMVEAYKVLNPNATITVQGIGSSAGMSGANEGTFDIGMASRELKDSELETLTPYVLALDGIAMVVNNENPMTNITLEQIKAIYTGEALMFDQIQ